MRANFIYSTSYHDALKEVILKINSRTVHLNVRHLLIVPERYTLLAEKYLYENTDGSFDVEVLSLNRLFYRMNVGTPLLSREGAIMLIRGMLASLDLKCFYRSAYYRGFCEKLYDAINDFVASGVAPDDIPATTPKLCDLKAVYAEYLVRIQGRFVDSMGKLALIARDAATNPYLNNVHIYVANFDYIDKATRLVFDALKERALSYTECVIKDGPVVSSPAEKYLGEGALAVKEAAKRIRYAAYSGIKYEDMAVITGNVDYARIKRIFTEFDIPCYIADNKRLSDNALSSFLLSLFDCVVRLRREDFISLSKNIYVSIDKKSADQFENYVNSRLIDYKGFFNEFDECEQTRKKLIELVKVAEQGIKQVVDAKSFGALLEDIFSAVSAERITEEACGSDAPIQKTRALVSLMEQVGIKGNFEFVSAVFSEGLKATALSSIPYEGGVIVGDPAAFRGGKYKFMAVLGFDDGFLPQIYDDSSLIGDDEKQFFTHMERADEINVRYERELAAALSSADRLFITFSEPSGMMDGLFEDAQWANVALDPFVMHAGSKKHAVELMTSLISRTENAGEDNIRLINALYKATGAKDETFTSTRVTAVTGAEKLFFPFKATSVSQLQSYFRCPFRHFADYGLKLIERDKGEMTPLDIGSFMHLIIESVVRSGDYSDVERAIDSVVDNIISRGGKYGYEANKEVLHSLKKEATKALKIYVSHLSKGRFKPIGQEIKFESELRGIKLIGKIDMADEYNGYVRLIDYKTGGYELKFSDVYYGKKIQLPLYMAAASRRYKMAAMFNFPFSYSWLTDKFDHRFSGFLLNDDDVIGAVDSTLSQAESEVFNLKIDGKGKLNRSDYLLTDDEMEALVGYAVKISENAVSEIKDGYVAPSPCDDECGYCGYACLCTQKSVRKTPTIKKSVFGESV